MTEKLKAVEKMIAKVQQKKDLTRVAAIDYMLAVATGRLAALWRYDETLPEGKQTKGILAVVGRKKRAPKTAKILPLVAADKPVVAKKSAAPKKSAKTVAAKTTKRKSAKKRKPAVQTEMVVEGAA